MYCFVYLQTENTIAPDVGRKLENLVFEDNFIDTSIAMNGANVTNGTHKNDTSHLKPADEPPTCMSQLYQLIRLKNLIMCFSGTPGSPLTRLA